MKTLSDKEFIEAFQDVERFPQIKDLAAYANISCRAIRKRRVKLENKYGIDLSSLRGQKKSKSQKTGPQQEITSTQALQNIERIKRLEAQLQEIKTLALSSQKLQSLIHDTKNKTFSTLPLFLTKKSRKKGLHGIPLLFLSDLHFDEVVVKEQVGGVNEYNRQIAENRILNTFKKAKNILFDFVSKPNYEGFVLALGGDLLSGNIHEELAETNNSTILDSVLRLTQILVTGIELMAHDFDNIFVPCVVGNHGRIHKKKRFKNRVADNYEWLIYHLLAKHFENHKGITFYIPDSPDAVFSIYNKTFLLTHGDQFRGGSGISGILTPLSLGLHRKQKKQAGIHKPFDVMMLGHFHQYIHTNHLIVNGSTKGYDEFANELNFAFEPPQQALFINHPKWGMIFRTPVLCDTEEFKEPTSKVEVFK